MRWPDAGRLQHRFDYPKDSALLVSIFNVDDENMVDEGKQDLPCYFAMHWPDIVRLLCVIGCL
jgi:hypothetical protein